MIWLAVDKNGQEMLFDCKPSKYKNKWLNWDSDVELKLPKGSIKKLIGRELTWDDEPVEIKEEERESLPRNIMN